MSLIIGSGSSALRKLNLAVRPFENRRPKRRLATIFWVLAGLASAWNLFLFVEYWKGSSSGRDDLRAVRAEIDDRARNIRDLEAALRSADLSAQNEHVRFLNRKIAERTFPWSRLFDDIAEVLPRNVRLESLAPSIPDSKKRRGEAVPESIEWIGLQLRGVSKTSEEILELVDAMFSASVFASPVLSDERDRDHGVEFDLGVRYRILSPEVDEELARMTDAGEMEQPEANGASSEPASSSQPNSGGPGQEASSATPALEGDAEAGLPTGLADAEVRTPASSASAERRSVKSSSPESQQTSAEPAQPEDTQRPPNERESSRNEATRPEPRKDPSRAEPRPTAVPGGVVASGTSAQATPGTTGSLPAQAPTPTPGQDPRRGQRRQVTADDVPQRTKDLADERFGRDQDVAPRVDNASRGGG